MKAISTPGVPEKDGALLNSRNVTPLVGPRLKFRLNFCLLFKRLDRDRLLRRVKMPLHFE